MHTAILIGVVERAGAGAGGLEIQGKTPSAALIEDAIPLRVVKIPIVRIAVPMGVPCVIVDPVTPGQTKEQRIYRVELPIQEDLTAVKLALVFNPGPLVAENHWDNATKTTMAMATAGATVATLETPQMDSAMTLTNAVVTSTTVSTMRNAPTSLARFLVNVMMVTSVLVTSSVTLRATQCPRTVAPKPFVSTTP